MVHFYPSYYLRVKIGCPGYLDGASKEREEVSANWQQNEHTVEIEAGGRSSCPGQSLLMGSKRILGTEYFDRIRNVILIHALCIVSIIRNSFQLFYLFIYF